jgi:class 3 adenylate cyclase
LFAPDVVRRILDDPEANPLLSHRAEVTVLQCDIRNSTRFVQQAYPEEVQRFLRAFHREVDKAAAHFQATSEVFKGEEALVWFNDPVAVVNHEERAVRMALRLQDSMAQLITAWLKRGYSLGLGIGLASGHATVGLLGTTRCPIYAVIGPTNLAARLCARAGPGQVLVDQHLLAAVEHTVLARPVGRLGLKGFARPVPVFEVLGIRAKSR